MNIDGGKDYVYCHHCGNVVSRSTYERHERKRHAQSVATENSEKQIVELLEREAGEATISEG